MDIQIRFEDARQLYELYETCVLADRHFKACQSDLFRRHVSASCKAEHVKQAFAILKDQIDQRTNDGKGE